MRIKASGCGVLDPTLPYQDPVVLFDVPDEPTIKIREDLNKANDKFSPAAIAAPGKFVSHNLEFVKLEIERLINQHRELNASYLVGMNDEAYHNTYGKLKAQNSMYYAFKPNYLAVARSMLRVWKSVCPNIIKGDLTEEDGCHKRSVRYAILYGHPSIDVIDYMFIYKDIPSSVEDRLHDAELVEMTIRVERLDVALFMMQGGLDNIPSRAVEAVRHPDDDIEELQEFAGDGAISTQDHP
ncbi:hypothetical protein BKA67DRAFT_665042 [Truncatella angustata]|uniref:Uncharacterized protein n=1 Tax=Truncatella angustata TaxID=152316 RepID=A0A9P8RG29_9PEZI|nr:uncharacterized protein BKA67DRAFT_665042 [Truncatella angustata]KAH6645207.1 hypothetical protein BKA67DRAFT_665042 [Truncatella angustata]